MRFRPISRAARRRRFLELSFRFPIYPPIRIADHAPDPSFVPFKEHTHAEHQRCLASFPPRSFAHDPQRRLNIYIVSIGPTALKTLEAKAVRAYAVGNFIRGDDMPIHVMNLWRFRPGFVDFS